jgi:hypothetical protein
VTEVVELTSTGTESREIKVGWFRIRQRVKNRMTRAVLEENRTETGKDRIRGVRT